MLSTKYPPPPLNCFARTVGITKSLPGDKNGAKNAGGPNGDKNAGDNNYFYLELLASHIFIYLHNNVKYT